MRIRDREYLLPEVLLFLGHDARPEVGLQFSLFADTDDLRPAGFAINCMNVPGAVRISHLSFELGAGHTDPLNELGESVICEPGAVLELSPLRLVFGPVHDGVVPVTPAAICRTRREAWIPVHGDLVARIVWDEPPDGEAGQLALPF